MSLKDIKGTYDAIFSLGDLCLASIQLRKNNLRPFAGPLDWMSSPSLSSVNRLLENRFEGFMELSNLNPTAYSTGVDSADPYLVVVDEAYQIVSSHDFKADENTLTHLVTYPEVKNKLNKRIQRFLEKMSTSQRILFVRTEATFSEVLELESILSNMVKKEFHILVVNHSNINDMVEKSWPLKRVTVLEFPNNEIWNGNDNYWKSVLDEVSLYTKDVDNTNDTNILRWWKYEFERFKRYLRRYF
ncbi:DUF1796 family putative cysteine peptidase [Priestia megaterium]|uniref:DUF1796 family putative cysteine peptidase n=1 Tax=Priestia megaterium TaxID=1404 RepID=UPI002041EE5F|nr:DUF1796 family putative cysteine peptidase [Priestia megaterium]MCM3197169.1 papain-like cysteine peptidase [Priestia megaterium]